MSSAADDSSNESECHSSGRDRACWAYTSSFENHVDEMIAKNPKEAAVGGIPGIGNKIRAFVDVIMRNKENIDTYKPEVSSRFHPAE